MTYADHLTLLIRAAFSAVPGLTRQELSQRAGLGRGWVSDFLATGNGTLGKGASVVDAIRDLCPTGPDGDELRRLLAVFDRIEAPDEGADGSAPGQRPAA
jgi:hypothetical protein